MPHIQVWVSSSYVEADSGQLANWSLAISRNSNYMGATMLQLCHRERGRHLRYSESRGFGPRVQSLGRALVFGGYGPSRWKRIGGAGASRARKPVRAIIVTSDDNNNNISRRWCGGPEQKQVKGVMTQLGVFFTSLSAEVTVTLFHKWRPA